VQPGPPKDHEVDFTIDGVPFDLKTSELPSIFVDRQAELVQDPTPLASWFYRFQSRERRFHLANRLFLVLCDLEEPGEAWRLRADVTALRASIDGFMNDPRLVELRLPDPDGEPRSVLTGVIPVLRPPSLRQLRMTFAPGATTVRPTNPPPDTAPSDRQLGLPLGE